MVLRKAQLVGTVDISGKPVSFFTPPHDEPDFFWVDVEELAKAFLPRDAARRMVKHAQQFGKDCRPATTAANGGRIATIICHSMAQGLCGAIDHWNGHGTMDGEGPAYRAYCFAAAQIESDKGALNSFEDIIAAHRNLGGPFMRSVKSELE